MCSRTQLLKVVHYMWSVQKYLPNTVHQFKLVIYSNTYTHCRLIPKKTPWSEISNITWLVSLPTFDRNIQHINRNIQQINRNLQHVDKKIQHNARNISPYCPKRKKWENFVSRIWSCGYSKERSREAQLDEKRINSFQSLQAEKTSKMWFWIS